MSTSSNDMDGKKLVHSQAREIIYNVYKFMKNEKESADLVNINRLQERVAAAIDVSRASLNRIIQEGSSNASFSTPHKERRKANVKSHVAILTSV